MKKIIIVGYPKSGNTWLTRLTADLVGCPVEGFLYNPNIFNIGKNIVGSKKIIFGSDFPLLNPQRILKEFNKMNKTEFENITNNNLLRLLG